ncbi:MAG: PepSY domain-containing protein [Steroidobacteraceae bacterium]
MRTLHRWVMTVFAVLFVYWAGSGITLAVFDLTDDKQQWTDGGGPGLRPKLNNDLPVLPAAQVGKQVATAIQAAHAAAPGETLTAVELRMTAAGEQVTVDVGGAQPRTLMFDVSSGALLSTTPIAMAADMASGMAANPVTSRNWHVVLKNWHRGNIVGTWGVGVAMFTGIALLLMTLSGIYLYFSLWRRQRASGRNSFFWS